MANRVKEDERNERIIRGLLKLPENRRCINCNSLGPQYVCTNFWTFVCTTCSGIHREFTHRVKSVSMAKFTSQEVAALQGGGNKRARDIYFKEWDPQRQTPPDSRDVERLRDFIKHVYVDRRYSGERNYGKTQNMKGDKEDIYDNKRTGSYQGGSRSPPYEERYERRYSELSSPGGISDDRNSRYSYDERRSPGYDNENRQYNDYRRSPARPEIINDWRREDRFGNGRNTEDCRTSDGDSKLEGRSPEWPKDFEACSPPMVRPVREILGDNVVPLRISEPPKANTARAVDGSVQTQRTASSSSLGSANGSTAEVKVENPPSLIDFDADPEPPVANVVPEAQQTSAPQTVVPFVSSTNDANWASFDTAPAKSQAPTSAPGNVAGLASGSGAPVAASMGNAAILPISGASPVVPAGNASLSPFHAGVPAAKPVSSSTILHPGAPLVAAPGLAPTVLNGGNSFAAAGQWPSVQQQQPSLFLASGQSTTQQVPPQFVGASGNQTWNVSLAPNVQSALSTPSAVAPQLVSQPAPVASSAEVSQPSAVEVKSGGRKELPKDLFTSTFGSFPAPIPGWHTGPPRGMGFNMQHAAVPMPTVPQQPKSTNPFDLNEPAPVQTQTFPSMASLQGALPNMVPSSGLQRTSSFGTPSPAWVPSHSAPYPSALPSQSPSFAPAMPPRPYMVVQGPGNMPLSGYQGLAGFGSEGVAYGAISMDQQSAGRFSMPATPQPFSSVGGNPFG